MRRRPLLAVALCLAFATGSPAASGQPEERTRGEVTRVDGETILVAVRSGPPPMVGDLLSVLKPSGKGNALSIGKWRVNAVLGTSVRAVRLEAFGGPPEAGMEAAFESRRGDGPVGGLDAAVPGAARSGVRGKVTEVRGREVTVRLEEAATPSVGDKVELSFAVGEDTIAVGEWRVTAVRPDGTLDAAPVEALAAPTTAMDATVWATGSRADALFQQASALRGTDPPRALELFLQAAAQGHAEAAEQAALAFQKGLGTPPDDVRAAPLLRQAAEAGRPWAQNAYGVLLSHGRGGLARDAAAATAWYRKAAAQGEPQGQANLCYNYLHGEGVERNEVEAFRLCSLAAAQENVYAIDLVGWMYQNGLGTAKDFSRAFRHYERAARLGWDNGQNNLGNMYEYGLGVDRDYKQALYWYGQSAAKGNAWAEWNLGRMYQDGLGVPRDQAAAVEHFRRAARAGHPQSQEKLRQLGVAW